MCGWIRKGSLASAPARDEFARRCRRHRSTEFGDQQIGRVGVVAEQLAQCPQLRPAEWLRRGYAVFQPQHMRQACLQIDQLSAQRYELRHT
jgi:hypothetical protein